MDGRDSYCHSIYESLYRTQRRLTNYQYHPQDLRPGGTSIAPSDTSALAHITSVHLRLRGEQDALSAAGIVASIPGVEDLAIHDEDWWSGGSVENANYCHKLYAALIFGTRSSAPRFPRLKSLLLKGLDFEACGSMLANVVDFKQVNELQIIDCQKVEHLLEPLYDLRLALRTVRLERIEAWLSDAFLSTVTALEELSVKDFDEDRRSSWKPDWTSLIPHAATFRSLRLNFEPTSDPPKAPFSDIQGFLTLCKSASNLQRLAVNCPHIEEEKWAEEEGFSAWLVSICALMSCWRSLTVFQDCLSNVRTLRSTELLVMPACVADLPCSCGRHTCDADGGKAEHYRNFLAQVDPVFRRAADKVFQTLGPNCPELMALQFRIRGEYECSSDPDYCCAFVRSTVIDRLGQTIYQAVSVEPQMLMEYGSESGVYQLYEEFMSMDPNTMITWYIPC
jgi:hypothetical protein